MKKLNQTDQYSDLSEIITTKEVCQKCFGNSDPSTRKNLYNFIKGRKFPQPLIYNRGFFFI